jgi:protein-tyrosine phosphatase
MLSIFNKQSFIVDYFDNAVDIHNHLLPGIDDGSPSVAVSQKMIDLYQEIGFSQVIATPHVMEDYYHNNPNKIRQAFDKLKSETDRNSPIPFRAAAEYMLDSQFDTLLENDELLPLHEDLVLVEMSFFQKPKTLDEKLFQMRQKDLLPVMAHPERYSYINGKNSFESLKDRGCYFQLNLLSLSGHYGKDAYKKAELLLLEDMIDFVATDAHKPEHLEKIKHIKVAKKLIAPLQKAIEVTKETFHKRD